MKIYLAVGHGERPDGTFDPGAVGGGWSEQSAGDIIVAEAARVLRDAGLQVKDEADQDDPNFVGTATEANRWGADVLVTVHHDWIGAPVGAFGFWVTGAGKRVADSIQQAVGDAGFPLRPSWHKYRDNLYVLNKTNMPACLYECGRIGQDKLNTEAELKAMGRAIAHGVADWADVPLEDDMDKDTIAKIDAIFAEVCVAKDDKVPGAPSGRTLRDRIYQTNSAAGRSELVLADLPTKVAEAVVKALSSAGTAAGVNTAALADEILAEIKERL